MQGLHKIDNLFPLINLSNISVSVRVFKYFQAGQSGLLTH